ncbi:type IX secretion system PorP/SprF family membrane protein [Aquimarina sp. MAR_2010_214]|uniref:PorP/SprF family type IX secretion system membrane protein n=1 Tax=Aquimarina sp. MAR_2010_214 TaxID=1250026 RepID=UPI000C700702|nr:type IX secretion system membrane protein PorP/SprF [Aquimarina sp. MAR_2010_214]PKV49353.1 type IX secretion system PorP/SprF family membrane protein [Aquimarina sp. MAR_2010_214]
MKYLKYIIFIITISFVSHAQQDPHFSMYRYNMNVITPAYAGINGSLEALFAVRSQWTGVKDGPETLNFNINSPVGDKIGVGLTAISDKVFVLDETHLYADFSYKIKINEELNLHAGVKAGGSFLKINLNEVGIEDDPLFTQNVNTFNPNVGVGFYLKAKKYYISLSAPGLLSNDRYEKEGLNPVSASDDLQMFLGGGYDFDLNTDFKFRPSVLGKVVNDAPISLDITSSILYKERIELGANYRLDESITGFFTANFLENILSIGYAYEHVTSGINTYTSGTHEVILKFKLK